MREIKFRAWDNVNNNMELNVHHLDSLNEILSKDKYNVMQFTGLLDNNGKEIYEGDRVSLHQFTQALGSSLGASEGERELVGTIEIREYGVYFNCDSNDDQESDYLILFNLHEESLEVIGNIFQQ